ncbi:MAG: RloB domain-containing protein [Magnetococcales bacterium]|nr:RloB domain-containing protein [Magnetococcales bacterium]NGZ25345.1 RloB domain-containing protein [Magnetococcales bacterium]
MRKFARAEKNQALRKRFIISTEGTKTEPGYFSLLQKFISRESINLQVLQGARQTDPVSVLERMVKHLQDSPARNMDQAWLVVDRDTWPIDQLNQLFTWQQKQKNYQVALSNPKFEYWLLLHFEDGNQIQSSDAVTNRLEKCCPNYTKNIDPDKFKFDDIVKAIDRAKVRYQHSHDKKFLEMGTTTVFKLVKTILLETGLMNQPQ